MIHDSLATNAEVIDVVAQTHFAHKRIS